MNNLYPHQRHGADQIKLMLDRHKFAYLVGEPRVGKTRTVLTAISEMGFKNPLILTKKRAIEGWQKEMKALGVDYFVTNYEQVHKLKPEYDGILIDEAHNFGSTGKATKRFKGVKGLAWDLPLLCLSGTPSVETELSFYYQTAMSKYGPFSKFPTFYKFFRAYGIPQPIWARGVQVETYKKAKPDVKTIMDRYSVYISQEDAGFDGSVQDVVHEVSLDLDTKVQLKTLIKHSVLDDYAFDSDMGLRNAVYQIESGAFLYEGQMIMLDNTEVVDYIKETFGDDDDIGLMCHFRSTRAKLEKYFSKAQIYSSNAHCEGIDLSHLRHLVIVNGDYSGARFIQRRDRISNLKKSGERRIHHIVTDSGISADVYDKVSNKKNYNIGIFRNARITNTKTDH